MYFGLLAIMAASFLSLSADPEELGPNEETPFVIVAPRDEAPDLEAAGFEEISLDDISDTDTLPDEQGAMRKKREDARKEQKERRVCNALFLLLCATEFSSVGALAQLTSPFGQDVKNVAWGVNMVCVGTAAALAAYAEKKKKNVWELLPAQMLFVGGALCLFSFIPF